MSKVQSVRGTYDLYGAAKRKMKKVGFSVIFMRKHHFRSRF